MKKFFIKDNVCTPYKLILNKTRNFLTANGWQSSVSMKEVDFIIVGCCGAFHSLENEAVKLIREAKETGARIIVFGCLPGISPEKVHAFKPDLVIHATNWERVEELIENPAVPLSAIPDANEFSMKEEYRLYDPGKQFLLIQSGCSSNCPYCPHKLGIGNLKSRSLDEILHQVKILTEKGAHTIVLTGNDTGSYGIDTGTISFPRLLKNILDISPDLHLSQLNADWVYVYRDELFPLIMNKKIKDFQVLIQTVSERLLKLMDRKPVVRLLYPYLKNVRNSRKDLVLRTDIMIGYPTATEKEEKETLLYVAELFDEIAVHGFERFPHTRIEKMDMPFYPQKEIDQRVHHAVEFLKAFPNILVHRGGQVYQTLVDIEKPKQELRLKKEQKLGAVNKSR